MRSLLGQTFEDFELIICDNCSTDKTGEICSDYAIGDPRIRYERNVRNLGAARNYDRTYYLSTGRFFKWAAADDACLPTYLERCIDVLTERPDVVLCHSYTKLIDELDRPLRYDEDAQLYIDSGGGLRLGATRLPKGVSNNPFERFSDVLSKTPPCFDVFGVCRRDIVGRTHLHGSWYGSDRAFLAEMALYGKLHQVPAELFLGREHGGQSIVLDRKAKSSWIGSHFCSHFVPVSVNIRLQLANGVRRSPILARDKLRCLSFLARRSGDWNIPQIKQLLETGWNHLPPPNR